MHLASHLLHLRPFDHGSFNLVEFELGEPAMLDINLQCSVDKPQPRCCISQLPPSSIPRLALDD